MSHKSFKCTQCMATCGRLFDKTSKWRGGRGCKKDCDTYGKRCHQRGPDVALVVFPPPAKCRPRRLSEYFKKKIIRFMIIPRGGASDLSDITVQAIMSGDLPLCLCPGHMNLFSRTFFAMDPAIRLVEKLVVVGGMFVIAYFVYDSIGQSASSIQNTIENLTTSGENAPAQNQTHIYRSALYDHVDYSATPRLFRSTARYRTPPPAPTPTPPPAPVPPPSPPHFRTAEERAAYERHFGVFLW